MLEPTVVRSPDRIMEIATRLAACTVRKTGDKLALVVSYQQDRIDDEGCGPVFAAARWPLVRKRKHRHKM